MTAYSEDSGHDYSGNREGNDFSGDEAADDFFNNKTEDVHPRLVQPLSVILPDVTEVGPSRRATSVESGSIEDLFGEEGEEEGGKEGEEEGEDEEGEEEGEDGEEGEEEEVSTSQPADCELAGPSRIRYAAPQKLTQKSAKMCSDGKVNVTLASCQCII